VVTHPAASSKTNVIARAAMPGAFRFVFFIFDPPYIVSTIMEYPVIGRSFRAAP
jgi:hypothetical protein